MIPSSLRKTKLIVTLVSLLCSLFAHGDIASAVAAMEDSDNPLIEVNTSKGTLYIELHPAEAPKNVARFLALAKGEIGFTDQELGTTYYPRYFDGMIFHRVLPEFVIQAGSPFLNPLGAPVQLLEDEINATALGLDVELVLLPDASLNPILNINHGDDFSEQVLQPLYTAMEITTPEQVISQQQKIVERLRSLSIKQLYQMQGYRFSETLTSRSISRGSLALANTGPDSNGAEFFLSLAPQEHLTGKYTSIGTVVEGLDVMDEIGKIQILASQPSRSSTTIYSIKEINK
ncbi:MAG: peptidylprolyl isomerase [Pseudohongiellaceae bacterium]